jgi:hypothetical protein
MPAARSKCAYMCDQIIADCLYWNVRNKKTGSRRLGWLPTPALPHLRLGS